MHRFAGGCSTAKDAITFIERPQTHNSNKKYAPFVSSILDIGSDSDINLESESGTRASQFAEETVCGDIVNKCHLFRDSNHADHHHLDNRDGPSNTKTESSTRYSINNNKPVLVIPPSTPGPRSKCRVAAVAPETGISTEFDFESTRFNDDSQDALRKGAFVFFDIFFSTTTIAHRSEGA